MIKNIKQWKLGEQFIKLPGSGMYPFCLRIKDNVMFSGGTRKCNITHQGRIGHVLYAEKDNIHVGLMFKNGLGTRIEDYEIKLVEINDIELE